LRPVRLLWVKLRARYGGLPNWKTLINSSEWKKILISSSVNENRVLIANSIGGHLPSTIIESMLGVALTIRNTGVDFLQCDGSLPACQYCEYSWFPDLDDFSKNGPKDLCSSCSKPAIEMFSQLGLPHYVFSDLLNESDFLLAKNITSKAKYEDISSLIFEGISVGEHALAGALRFFARGDLKTEFFGESILRRYLEASILTALALKKLLKRNKYKCIILNHGIYVPQGIIVEVARQNNIRIVVWHPGYRKSTFLFSSGNSYHHTMIEEPRKFWENISWDNELDSRITNYLNSRWTGSEDWIWFAKKPKFDASLIHSELGLDIDKPIIGLFTNVVWDAQIHYESNVFDNMLDWIIQTIDYFINRKDLQLVIRIHPAEIYGGLQSRQKVFDEICFRFPELTDNIFVIPPENSISSYVMGKMCDSVLIYGTKMGIEFTSIGIPVIVAGESWIRGKGVTIDVSDINDYFQLLDRLPSLARMPEDQVIRAKKYAFHYFFRRLIPFEFIAPSSFGWPPYRINIKSIEELKVGNSPGLDLVCSNIILGGNFVYKAESDKKKSDKLYSKTG
jgi:hypothetical protein